jgi:DNA-directed RNA polymerase subunit H (RpoH/RPB5)
MVDLPASVIKTRALLTLRGYKVDDLFEYEDRYVMLPAKQMGEEVVKSVVWVFKEAKVVGVAIVKDIARDMEEAQAQEGVLVGGSRFTPAARKFARASRVELVEGTYSSFDLFQHELVPKHTIINDDEIKMVLKHFSIKKPQLPRILRDDPAAKVLGAKAGQVIRIERDSPTAGRTFYYRLVVESSR